MQGLLLRWIVSQVMTLSPHSPFLDLIDDLRRTATPAHCHLRLRIFIDE
jgi:hypothetical protein